MTNHMTEAIAHPQHTSLAPVERRRGPAPLRVVAALAAALALACVTAPAALADAASIDFLDAAGRSDPVAGIGRTFTLAGSSRAPKRIYVKFRAPGGAPCAPSAYTDSGDSIDDSYGDSIDEWYGTRVNGSFRLTFNDTWRSPGTFLFCIWIADSSSATASPIAQTITFRNPAGVISATTSPIAPLTGQPTTVTITGASEAPKSVYAKVRLAGGAPCGPSYSVDPGESVVSDLEVNGAFSTAATITRRAAGTYLLCLWLADSSEDPTPVAGPQPVIYTVTAPGDTGKVRPIFARPGMNARQKGRRVVVRVTGRLVKTAGRPCSGRVAVGARTGGRKARHVFQIQESSKGRCTYRTVFRFRVGKLKRAVRSRRRRLLVRINASYKGSSQLRGDKAPSVLRRVIR